MHASMYVCIIIKIHVASRHYQDHAKSPASPCWLHYHCSSVTFEEQFHKHQVLTEDRALVSFPDTNNYLWCKMSTYVSDVTLFSRLIKNHLFLFILKMF